jgi:hypothetical protein
LNKLPLTIGGLIILALLLLLFINGGRKRRSVATASGTTKPVTATTPLNPNPKSAMSGPAGPVADIGRVDVPSDSPIGAPAVEKETYGGEESEREVFEL